MKLLLDTNIFLEVILDQESAEEARTPLSKVEEHEFFLSGYSLHSIGLLLFHRGQHEIFRQFLIDMILEAGGYHHCPLSSRNGRRYPSGPAVRLDFEDAYQYAVAERYGLTIISFDGDFDRTARGRKTPEDLIFG